MIHSPWLFRDTVMSDNFVYLFISLAIGDESRGIPRGTKIHMISLLLV